jgi:hypothetical protein
LRNLLVAALERTMAILVEEIPTTIHTYGSTMYQDSDLFLFHDHFRIWLEAESDRETPACQGGRESPRVFLSPIDKSIIGLMGMESGTVLLQKWDENSSAPAVQHYKYY